MTKISLTSQLRARIEVKEIKQTDNSTDELGDNFQFLIWKLLLGNYKVGNSEECQKRVEIIL